MLKMTKLTKVVVFVLTTVVHVTVAAEYVHAGIEQRYYTDETCYPPDGYKYYDLEPRLCINRHVNQGNGLKYEFVNEEITTVTCVHSPQSQVKITYYEKEESVSKKVLESVDKGRVLVHVRLHKDRSTYINCESNDTGLIQQVDVPLNGNAYKEYIHYSMVNGMPCNGYVRQFKNENDVASARTLFEYFSNYGESQTVKFCANYNYVCSITPGYQTNSNIDFGKTKNAVFTFDNSSDTKSINCVYSTNTRLKLNIMPYSQMPSTLTSDFIFVRGLQWNRMTNKYVRRDLDKYNFIYTYHYKEEELKLTCVSKSLPTWKYIANNAITINGEVNYYSGENAYFGEITLKFNKDFDDTAIYCSSTSGHTATVILHRYQNHASGYRGYIMAPKMYSSTNNDYIRDVVYKGQKGLAIANIQNNGSKTGTDLTTTENYTNETIAENSVAYLDKRLKEKLALSDQAFGAFIGLELANVPLKKRRTYMYNIIKSLDDNSSSPPPPARE